MQTVSCGHHGTPGVADAPDSLKYFGCARNYFAPGFEILADAQKILCGAHASLLMFWENTLVAVGKYLLQRGKYFGALE